MKHSLKTGLCFGSTSGIITTLGLIVGLSAGTQSQLAVIGGIIIIAIADAFSDAFGIHVAEEAENKHSSREIWESTFSTFFFKFVFAITFVVPMLLFELQTAILASIGWGLLLLAALSYSIAEKNKAKAVAEHVIIALVVITITHFVGNWVAVAFA